MMLEKMREEFWSTSGHKVAEKRYSFELALALLSVVAPMINSEETLMNVETEFSA